MKMIRIEDDELYAKLVAKAAKSLRSATKELERILRAELE